MSVPTKPLRTRSYVIFRIASIVVLMISVLIVLAQALIVRSGAYHDESVVIIFMLAIIIGMVALVWRYGERMEEIDRHRHRTENALSESSARYRALFEYSNDAVIVLDADGHYIDANVQAEHLTGYTRDELLKLHVGDLSPEREVNRTRGRLKILNEEGIFHSESTLLRKDRTETPIETSIVMIFPGVYQSIIHDISKRKEAEAALRASEARYRGLFEYSNDAVIVIDTDGHYVDANVQAERLTGYTRDELLKLSVGDLAPAHEADHTWERFKILSEESIVYSEGILLRKDKTEIPTENSSAMISPGIYQSIVRDISKRKEAEAALRASEARYRDLFEYSGEAIVVLDDQGRYIEINSAMERLSGYSREELLHKKVGELSPPGEQELSLQRFKEISFDHIWAGEEKMLRKDGSEIFVELTVVLVAPGLYQAILRNVHERITAEAALRTSEARYRALFEHSNDAIILMDAEGHYIDANAKAEVLTGYSRDELLQLRAGDLATGSEVDVTLDRLRILNETGTVFTESVLRRKDRTDIPIESSSAMVVPGMHQAIVRDTSERKAAEAALRASETRYRGLFEFSYDAILVIDNEGRYLDTNPAMEHLTGYSHDELLQMRVPDLTPARDWNYAIQRLTQATAAGFWKSEDFLRRKDGSEILVELSVVTNGSGVFQAVLRDIHEHKKAQEALRASEARYRGLFEHSNDGIMLFDQDGHYLDANPQAERLTGYSRDEILTRRLGDFAARPAEGQALIEGIRRDEFLFPDYAFVRKDGTEVAAEISVSVVEGGLYQAIIHDISARKQTEDNLRRSLEQEHQLNQMKTRFVSMVSHDFRTPLSVIRSSTDLLLSYSDRMDPAKRRDRLEKIQRQIEHMVQMLDDILIIGKAETVGMEFHAEPLNLLELCESIVSEFQQGVSSHTFVFKNSGVCTDVLGDPNLLRRALVNLLSNAVKYSPEQGSILFDLTCGDREIILRIQDYGIGIPLEDQPRLFEPFHRASNVGGIKGTGLGLPIVKQVIDAHHGTIEVESQPNTGTTFIITLPNQPA